MIIFYLFGYAPNQKKERKASIVSALFAVLFLAILTVPLISSFKRIITNEQEKNTIQAVTNGYLSSNFSNVTLESFDHGVDMLSLSIKAPVEAEITEMDREELTKIIATALNKDVELSMTIVPFTSVKVNNVLARSPLEKANDQIELFLEILYPPVLLLDVEIREKSQSVLIVELFTTEEFSRTRFKTQLEEHLQEK